jgi:predicted ATP-grasp superfamily ATP-dependent carboligase
VKILIFEYITGGGFNKQPLPESLITEGSLMLRALLDNLAKLDNVEVTVMLEERLGNLVTETFVNMVLIGPEHDSTEEFARLVAKADVVWPIAPEFNDILQNLCLTVTTLRKILLNSSAKAVAIAGNKFKTYELLKQFDIATVPTWMYDQKTKRLDPSSTDEWIIKPVDGVGCTDSYVISSPQDLEQQEIVKNHYVIQPHLQGDKTSLSCLFKQGQGWLICANLQHFELINSQYQLIGIDINHHADSGQYQHVIDQIALALPGLWGYVGIDLIETSEHALVLEINPRLTTSFVGINDALGINIAEAVLQLVHGEPILKPTSNKVITVKTHAR